MPPEPTDEEVARRALGDKEEFALLIARYEAKLGRYLERLGVAGREDREDILQNAFIKAYRNLASFDPELSFSSWMYRIAHNETMTFFRARRARPTVELDEEGTSLISEIRDERADTAAAAALRLSARELGAALERLPQKYRDALTLRFFEERSYAEMSDILEMPVGTVSTLIHRAKKALREMLAGRIDI
ncbi:MAG TPA: sigma-70 family RNA polymerase sigma factor [Candidatus Paceibacterota bacterium]|nr:sigma-70 family RNA polymerase sigma factor [Candidatus Paceibacterota bacterium]